MCECPPVGDLDMKLQKALKLSNDIQAPKDEAVDLN